MNKIVSKPRVAPTKASNDLLEGWDTVFAIRYADVNSAIVKAGSSQLPKSRRAGRAG